MKKIPVVTAALLAACIFIGSSFASSISDPSYVGVGARPMGMGKAYTGLADDASSIFLNPSGLVSVDMPSFTSMRATLIGDVNYTVLGGTLPVAVGTFGLGYINSSITSIPLTRLVDNSGVKRPEMYGSSDYNSNVFLLSYALPASRIINNYYTKNLSLGTTLKLFTQGFSADSGTMEGSSGSGFDMDFGVKYRFQKWLNAGAVLTNFLPVSMGGKFVWIKNSIEESIPASLKTGVSIKLLGQDGLRRSGSNELVWVLDSDCYLKQSGSPVLLRTGLEWKPVESLALRVGFDQQNSAQTSGAAVETNLTCGIGINMMNFSFDYAYHQYGDLSENTTHYFSIGYIMPVRSNKPASAETTPSVRTPLRVRFIDFPDVPRDYWAAEPVLSMAALGVMSGYADGTFGPDKTMGKAEFVSIIVRAKWPGEIKAVSGEVFGDVPASFWAAPFLSVAANKKLIVSEGKNFYPSKDITRAEAVNIAVKFSNLIYYPLVFVKPYQDVPQNYWASRQIAAAKVGGFLSFIKGEDFEPNKPLTRAEAAFILSRTDFFEEKIDNLFL